MHPLIVFAAILLLLIGALIVVGGIWWAGQSLELLTRARVEDSEEWY